MSAKDSERALAALSKKLEDQRQRIAALARGREEDQETISELRAELALISRERDELHRQLVALEGMQTETLTQGDEPLVEYWEGGASTLPSIDELMTAFSGENKVLASHRTLKAEPADSSPSGEYQEMLAPEEMVLDSPAARARSAQRYLIVINSEAPARFELDQNLMTIGRSESADIQIDGDFVSRIHARVLRIGMDVIIEDAGSKNGTRVNSDLVDRHVLRHGDLVRVGSVHFRYFDSAAAEGDDE